MMSMLMDNVLPVLGLVLGFSFLIFIHELGHFLVAKWVGVRCTQFAIGFGHALLSYRKGMGVRVGSTEAAYERRAKERLTQQGVNVDKLSDEQRALRLFQAADELGLGETEYRFNWMPLGGYVKMLGQEDMDPTARSEDPRSFNRKPVWARACIISAGVTMNLIFGVLFFVIAFMAGVRLPPAIVGGTVPGSPAANATVVGGADDEALRGLRAGDRILKFNDSAVIDFADVAVNVALARGGQPVRLTVQREGEAAPLVYEMTPVKAGGPDGKLLSIGVERPISLTLGGKAADLPEPLRSAGVTPGQRVVAVAGQPVAHFHELEAALAAAAGEPVEVTLAGPDGATTAAKLAAVPALATSPDAPEPGLLGLTPVVKVARVVPGSPAEGAGLQSGDVFAQLGGVAAPDGPRLMSVIAEANGRPLAVRVWRDGELVDLGTATPSGGRLGFERADYLDRPMVAQARPGSPAAALELEPGSRIVAVNGTPVASWADLQRALAAAANRSTDGGSVRVDFERNLPGSPRGASEISFNAEQARLLAQAKWLVPPLPLEYLAVPVTASDPISATAMGLHKTKQFVIQTYITLARLFQRTVPFNELRGPVGIFQMGVETAKQGWTYLLFFLGLISVNLVVINFLPIPIVDGGLMVFLIIEKLRGKPVPPAVLNVANMIGLALIATVMLATLYFDVSR